jgi:hypothetical protein
MDEPAEKSLAGDTGRRAVAPRARAGHLVRVRPPSRDWPLRSSDDRMGRRATAACDRTRRGGSCRVRLDQPRACPSRRGGYFHCHGHLRCLLARVRHHLRRLPPGHGSARGRPTHLADGVRIRDRVRDLGGGCMGSGAAWAPPRRRGRRRCGLDRGGRSRTVCALRIVPAVVLRRTAGIASVHVTHSV